MNSGMEEKKYDCVRGFIAVKTRNGHSALYKAFPMRCKSWDCPYCAKIKGDQYKQRMKPLFDRGSLYFYTFTFYHNLPALESWSSVSSTWNRFRTAAAKKYGRFSYVRVLEHHHRSNYPHLHVIADVRFNDVWLAKELKTAGFGYQCCVKPVDGERAAEYVSKYLTKPWDSAVCRAMRKNLKLRLISFGGDACLGRRSDKKWSLLAMALNCADAIDAINRDRDWAHGSNSITTYEETGFDSYELTIIIPEKEINVQSMSNTTQPSG
jgi:hypothetical protein